MANAASEHSRGLTAGSQSAPEPPAAASPLQPGLPFADLKTAPPPFNPIGSYQLTGVLGRGGMGVVYRAVHLRLRKNVALKVIRSDRPIHRHTLERFDRELL